MLRLAGDGTADVCSFLYGAAARAGKAAGYLRLVTYTLSSETGISLRAAGCRSPFGRAWPLVVVPGAAAAGSGQGRGQGALGAVDGRGAAEPRKRWLGLEQPSGQGSLETLWSAAA